MSGAPRRAGGPAAITVDAEALAFFVLLTVGERPESREEFEEVFRTASLVLAAEELYPGPDGRRRVDFGGQLLPAVAGRLAVGRARDEVVGAAPRWVLVEQQHPELPPRVAHLELRWASDRGEWVAAALARLAAALDGPRAAGEAS